MGMLARKQFPLGWTPDADKTDAPPGCLLRMDNLILDERNMLSLRFGSSIISTLSDNDVHSLYTQVLNSTRYRLAAAGANVYSNGTTLSVTMAGSGDVSFESYLGQIFFARSTTKKKFDGTTVRNWGTSMTGGTPTVTAVAGPAGGVIIDGDAGTDLEWEEDDGGGEEYARGYLYTPSDRTRAAAMVANVNTGRSTIVRRWATDQDFSGPDTATLQVRVRIAEPLYTKSVTLRIGTGQDLNSDFFSATWGVEGRSVVIESTEGATSSPTLSVQQGADWYLLTIKRSDMVRVGNTDGRGWDTIQSAFVIIEHDVDIVHRVGRENIYDENGGAAGGEWDWTDPDTAPWDFGATAVNPTGETPDDYENGPTRIDGTSAATSDRALGSSVTKGPIYLGNKHLSWLFFSLRGDISALQLRISLRAALSRTPPYGDLQGSEYTLDPGNNPANRYAAAWDNLDRKSVV